jgi:hypothetical protein
MITDSWPVRTKIKKGQERRYGTRCINFLSEAEAKRRRIDGDRWLPTCYLMSRSVVCQAGVW